MHRGHHGTESPSGSISNPGPDRAPKAPAVFLEQVSFGFAETRLFRDLNFTIAAGRWTCLLGPSGCGKSTLLRIISGSLRRGLTGAVRMGSGLPRRGQTAWMAQKDLLFPWLTVLENVCLGARLRGRVAPETVRKARDLICSAGLERYTDAYPAVLSGGMRQRTALLRTLMEERPVILMDEPFSALDALTRLKLQDLAARLLQGATVLLVTHDPLEALRMGHHIRVMTGRPARLRNAPVPPGSPPRDPSDPAVAILHGELLQRLTGDDGR